MRGAKRKPSKCISAHTWSVKPAVIRIMFLNAHVGLVIQQAVEDMGCVAKHDGGNR